MGRNTYFLGSKITCFFCIGAGPPSVGMTAAVVAAPPRAAAPAVCSWVSLPLCLRSQDDTYVQLMALEHDLRSLAAHRIAMYGFLTLGLVPDHPVAFGEEQKPRGEERGDECGLDARKAHLLAFF